MTENQTLISAMQAQHRRRYVLDIVMVGLLVAILAYAFVDKGAASFWLLMAQIACYAVLALGLTIQWGYAGIFNAGVLGFLALGGFSLIFASGEPTGFWRSDQWPVVLGAVLVAIGSGVVAWAIGRFGSGWPKRLRALLQAAVLIIGVVIALRILGAAAEVIEREFGYIGGLGLPALVGWALGGALAAAAAYAIGRACLGLRSDYLAIATLGAAEIIKAVLKNEDWLTRGTKTVGPTPWPTPTTLEVGFEWGRIGYGAVVAVLIVIVYLLMMRAYHAPWGRMIRAIREEEDAASAMGKEVDRRRLQIFVLGSALIGIGGAALTGLNNTFDPGGYRALESTFLIWVMVIVGGAGNNFGAIFGAALIWWLWTNSQDFAVWLFGLVEYYGALWFDWEAPRDFSTRALQMRVFIIGLVIALSLRFAPRGLFPERPPRSE